MASFSSVASIRCSCDLAQEEVDALSEEFELAVAADAGDDLSQNLALCDDVLAA